jgi:ABC-type Fe3+/spermidine/putrescine transport system ATPase subunit
VPARVARAAGERSVVAVGEHRTLTVALPPGVAEGQAVHVAIRPESLRLSAPGAPGNGSLPGCVAEVTFLGNLTDCHVTLDDGTRVRVQVDPREVFEIGQRVEVGFDAEAASVFTL